MSDNEGWTTVTGRVKKPYRVPVETRQSQSKGEQFAALERKADEGVLKVKRVDPTSITELVAARLALGWTQEQTDAACAMPKNTIKKIESGHLVPLGGYLRLISRTLKVNLRLIDA
jgi:ribosome-binding protein aMBF1 (putative translation factor)